MKKIALGLIVCMAMVSYCFAGGPAKCYTMELSGSESSKVRFLLIDTPVNLTHGKQDAVKDQAAADKLLNDIGKTIYGRLMKIADVSNVIISARQIAVFKFPLPVTWESGLVQTQVCGILDDVLCGGKK
jgi:hypothetical protein